MDILQKMKEYSIGCVVFYIFAKNYTMLIKSHTNFSFERGRDEAGRGCLAGPTLYGCSSVLLPEFFANELLNDSKQLSEKNREFL